MMPDIKFKAIFRSVDIPADFCGLSNLELYTDTIREDFSRIM